MFSDELSSGPTDGLTVFPVSGSGKYSVLSLVFKSHEDSIIDAEIINAEINNIVCIFLIALPLCRFVAKDNNFFMLL